MAIQPLGDRVLVKALESEEKTKGGIVLPDIAKERPSKGEIIAVGTGKVFEDGSRRLLSVKVGDKIIFGKYAGAEVKIKDQEYLILREEDILAVVK